MFWWEQVDLRQVEYDLEAAVTLELRHLSFELLWNDFQADRERVSVPAMRSLEHVLDMAADRGVRVMLTLFPVEIAGLLWLPSWALSLDSSSNRPVLSGHSLTRRGAGDLFHDPAIVQAEVRLVRELVGAFRDHPAISGWVLGARMTSAVRPASAAGFEEWLGTLADAARSAGSAQPLWHAFSSRDLVTSSAVDPSVLSHLGVRLLLVDDWQASWAGGAGAWWIAFLSGYAARLTASPPLVANVGLCTLTTASWPSESCVEEARAAHCADEALTRARETGAGGCIAAFLFDFRAELLRSPPFSYDARQLTRGLLHPDRSPKEAAVVWRDRAREHLKLLSVPGQFPAPDPELRQSDPEGVARECFEAFTR